MGWFWSTNDGEIDGHCEAPECKKDRQGDGLGGDAAGLPGAGAELADKLHVTEGGEQIDEDAECYKRDAGAARQRRGVYGGMTLDCIELAEKEGEAADGEADAHQAKAGADPGKEGALGSEEDAWIVLGGALGHGHGCSVRAA